MKLKKHSTFSNRILQTVKLHTMLETMANYQYYKLCRKTKEKIKFITIKRNKIKIYNNHQHDTN